MTGIKSHPTFVGDPPPARPAVQVTHHDVRFERNTKNARWRAFCICGWFEVGTQEEVQSRAAVHDLEWVAVEPEVAKEAQT